VCSAITGIICGVPQGLILGPLLFLLYINDINNVVPNGIAKLLADDTNVFIHGRNSSVVTKNANCYMQRLNE
jgi:Reverse transcriptase (RNA-dependent DNA polymerase)